ncbi:MAG TPA: riboflavin synthase [Pseudogracilibacillus sp.]|nr:riboflavin synthase [Pseudogracilibacillus sp.]
MFTGIVEEMGRIKQIEQLSERAVQLTIEADKVLTDVQLGDSIAVNGICLTVTKFTRKEFSVDVMPETIKATSLHSMEEGTKVNLERSLQAQDRLGGHFVTGHVDTVGKITRKEAVENAVYYDISLPENVMIYFVEKGSIAVDGVSLTVFAVDQESVTISLIPHTLEVTILGEREVGDVVNIECDMLAKHVHQQMKYYQNMQA